MYEYKEYGNAYDRERMKTCGSVIADRNEASMRKYTDGLQSNKTLIREYRT